MTKRFSAFFTLILLATLWPWQAMSQDSEVYSIPLRFSVIDDGVVQLPLELDYDLTAQSELRLGDLFIGPETFKIRVGTMDELSAIAAPYASAEERRNLMLMLQWPLPLLPEGFVEAIGQSGRAIWQAEITAADIQSWAQSNADLRLRMGSNVKKDALDLDPVLSSTWVFRDIFTKAAELVESPENFRLCISRQTPSGQSRLCSPYMSLRNKNRKWVLEVLPEPVKPARVISFQKQSPLKSRRRIKTRGAVQFLAELSNGYIYEFVTRLPRVEIVELVEGEKENMKIVGFGQAPSMTHRILNPLEESFIVRTFKWQETIGDFRRFWEVDIPRTTKEVYFPGPSGGLFKQVFNISRLPREGARPYIDYHTPDSTYVDGAKIFGVQAKETTLSSTELQVNPTGETPDTFLWNFKAEKRGELNRAHLVVQDGKQTFKTYYEMFKGYPRELSFRSSAILGSSGNILATGEVAFNYWYEDLFGWSDPTFSRHRWGSSVKYFQSLTPLKISKTSATMTNITFDLKYRFNPGLWGRDESWGAILGYNDLKYDLFKSQMVGGGVFWARSMPRLFDDLLNRLSFFRYPKWVDLEFIYYPVAMNKDVSTLNQLPSSGGNFSLNFHGKVMWKKSFFGEAGFGLRTLDVNQEVDSAFIKRLRFQFASLYGTVGLGYQF